MLLQGEGQWSIPTLSLHESTRSLLHITERSTLVGFLAFKGHPFLFFGEAEIDSVCSQSGELRGKFPVVAQGQHEPDFLY